MSTNKVNSVSIGQKVISFEEIYKGKCNNHEFKLIYKGVEDRYSEEILTTIEILWENDIPQRVRELEEGIRRVFRRRLESERN